jgi:Fic family protein
MNLTYLEIDYRRSDYESLPPVVREAFEERLLLSWVFHEHAMEGVVLTQDDVVGAMRGRECRTWCEEQVHKSLRRLRMSCQDVLKGHDKPEEIMTLEWIKAKHVSLCDAGAEHAGRYRKRDTSPGVYNLDVVPGASISYYFRKMLDQYQAELSKAHPVRAAAQAHWEFMKVFPFDEKSGLVGRLMLNALLVSQGYPPAVIHAQDRHHYFAALNGHRTDMIPVVVEAISSTMQAATMFMRHHGAELVRQERRAQRHSA